MVVFGRTTLLQYLGCSGFVDILSEFRHNRRAIGTGRD
jgi:hypothetical protein